MTSLIATIRVDSLTINCTIILVREFFMMSSNSCDKYGPRFLLMKNMSSSFLDHSYSSITCHDINEQTIDRREMIPPTYERRRFSGDDVRCGILEHGDQSVDDRAANPRDVLRLQEQVREKVRRRCMSTFLDIQLSTR